MKLFSHKPKKQKLETEYDDELQLEDILAEYQAQQDIDAGSPYPDAQGEYYSSSQGGTQDYYDSQEHYVQAGYDYGSQPDYDYASILADASQWDSQEPAQSYDAEVPAETEPYSIRSGKVGEMERDAWAYIAQLQQRTQNLEEASREEAPAEMLDIEAEYDREYGYVEASPEEYTEAPSHEVIDSRFNLSGQRKRSGYYFGDRSVDISADDSYSPSQQTDHNLSHWAPEEGAPREAEPEDEEPRKKGLFKRRKKKEEPAPEDAPRYSSDYDTLPPEEDEPYAQGFKDYRASSADYAQDRDYEQDYDFNSHGLNQDDPLTEDDMPSFGEYVASLFASFFLRLRGTARSVTPGTMSDTQEDLGPELTPAAACKYYSSFMRSQKLRLRISLVMLLLLCYLSLELPVFGMLQHLPVTAAACCALQFGIMLLCLDVVTTGVLNAFRLKIGADSLAVLSCLVTGLDGMIVALSDSAALHIPFCALSSLSLYGVMLSSSLATRGLRKSLRVPAIGKKFYSVTCEAKLSKSELTLLKSTKALKGFVRRTEEAAPDETLFIKLGPILIILALLLSLIVAALQKSFSDLVFIFSAVLAPAAPFGALLAFALPYFTGANRMFRSGAAVAGWSGVCDIGVSRNLIVTDRDLFPENSIEMDKVRIFSDESTDNVISYAATLVSASGASSAACFVKLMEDNGYALRTVQNFEPLSGGGVRGIIDGHIVLCGGMEFMRLMNIKLSYKLTGKTTVLLAIDGRLAGSFALKYEPLPQVRKALVELVRSGRHPVFAIRDFNVNPEMLHNTFDLATDGYDFPPYVERYAMSDSAEKSRIAAVLCNEGLGPLTEVADVGRSIYLATRFNIVVAALAAFLGSILVFVKLITAGSVTIGFLLLFMLAWAVPSLITSLYVVSKS